MLPRLFLSACTALAACQPAWEPPGDGVAKGCVETWSHDEPIRQGLGLSTHVSWGTDDDATAQREFELSQWPWLGVRTARRDMYWSSVEPEQGSFDFSGTDLLVDEVQAAGAELLGLLVYGNEWACSDCDSSMYPPDDPATYAAYAAALAARYGGRVRRWEIWNEPNGGIRFWKPQEDPLAFAALALAAAQAIHGVDPGADVALGGLFWPDLLFATPGPEFLDDVLEAEPSLVDELDAVAWHPYRYPFTAPEHSDETQASLLEESCALWEQLEAHGGGALDVRITELGWHTAPDALYEGVDEEEQAAYLVRSTVLAYASGSSMYLWYTFMDGGDSDSDQEQRFGLYSHDQQPKAAATAFSVMARALGEAGHSQIHDRAELLGLDEQGYAYLVDGEQGEVWVLWTTEGEREITMPARDDVRVLDLAGGETTVVSEHEAVTVQASPSPVFVMVPEAPNSGR